MFLDIYCSNIHANYFCRWNAISREYIRTIHHVLRTTLELVHSRKWKGNIANINSTKTLDISTQERCMTKFALKTGFHRLYISPQVFSKCHDDTSFSTLLQCSLYFLYISIVSYNIPLYWLFDIYFKCYEKNGKK